MVNIQIFWNEERLIHLFDNASVEKHASDGNVIEVNGMNYRDISIYSSCVPSVSTTRTDCIIWIRAPLLWRLFE